MLTLRPHQKMFTVFILVILLTTACAFAIYVEDANAQSNVVSYPPIIWIQAHEYDNGWGIECQKGCDEFLQLGNEQELNMRFPDSWMVVNWYYYLFNRLYCGPTNVCLEPLPEPMIPTG